MEHFWNNLLDILLLTLNGGLAVAYWVADHLPVAVSWLIAAGVIVLLDNAAGRQAGFRPRRYDRGSTQRESLSIYTGTAGLVVAWTVVGLIAPAPIPLIGLTMWAALLLVPLIIPLERDPLAGRLKWMMGVYVAACAAFMVLLRSSLDAAALSAWSRQLGQPGAGNVLESAIVSSVTPYAALMLWVIGPLMYFGYIAQRLAVNWKTKVSPWLSVEDRLRELRTRGE